MVILGNSCNLLYARDKNELLTGFLAIHHQKQKDGKQKKNTDMILPIYLSNQKILMFANDLIEGDFVSKNGEKILHMTLCINKYTRSDGKLARVFLDDLGSHNREISAEIRMIEARQFEAKKLPGSGHFSPKSVLYEQLKTMSNGETVTTINQKMAHGQICLTDQWKLR